LRSTAKTDGRGRRRTVAEERRKTTLQVKRMDDEEGTNEEDIGENDVVFATIVYTVRPFSPAFTFCIFTRES